MLAACSRGQLEGGPRLWPGKYLACQGANTCVCGRHSAAKIRDSFPEDRALAGGCPSAAFVTALSFPLRSGWVGEAGGGAAQRVLANHVPPCPCCRLRPVDVEFMKALHEKVNIVPLIAKADCLIPSEIRKLKERVRCSFCTEIYLM